MKEISANGLAAIALALLFGRYVLGWLGDEQPIKNAHAKLKRSSRWIRNKSAVLASRWREPAPKNLGEAVVMWWRERKYPARPHPCVDMFQPMALTKKSAVTDRWEPRSVRFTARIKRVFCR